MPSSLPPPTKRRKTQRDGYSQSIKQLEDGLHDSVTKNGSLNSLADLLELAYTVQDPHDTSKAIYALYRVFVVIISNKKLDIGSDEAAKVVKAWIWERFQSYVDFLASLLQDEEKFLRVRMMLLLSTCHTEIISIRLHRCRSCFPCLNIFLHPIRNLRQILSPNFIPLISGKLSQHFFFVHGLSETRLPHKTAF